MTNADLLEQMIEQSGIKKNALAKMLNITPRKIHSSNIPTEKQYAPNRITSKGWECTNCIFPVKKEDHWKLSIAITKQGKRYIRFWGAPNSLTFKYFNKRTTPKIPRPCWIIFDMYALWIGFSVYVIFIKSRITVAKQRLNITTIWIYFLYCFIYNVSHLLSILIIITYFAGKSKAFFKNNFYNFIYHETL